MYASGKNTDPQTAITFSRYSTSSRDSKKNFTSQLQMFAVKVALCQSSSETDCSFPDPKHEFYRELSGLLRRVRLTNDSLDAGEFIAQMV